MARPLRIGGFVTPVASRTRTRARELHTNLTDAEQALWRYPRRPAFSQAKFRRQHPAGPYILDFYCAAHRLAIQIDGDPHEEPAVIQHDRRRSHYLARRHIRILRFSAREALGQTDAVIDSILATLTLPSPTTAGEGGSDSVNQLRGIDVRELAASSPAAVGED